MSALIDTPIAWQALLRLRGNPAKRGGGPLDLTADGGLAVSGYSTEARLLLDTLLPVLRSPDCVVGQIGQSLDGRIATRTGSSHYITGPASRVHLHRLRALVDAVIVGANTVIADDPELTVRHVEGDSPLRVVLDPHGRVPANCRVFTDGRPSWHVVATQGLAAPAATAVVVGDADPTSLPRIILEHLRERGYRRVLIEGGSTTLSSFIAAHCLDRLHVVVAPFLMGSGKPALVLPAIDALEHALRPHCRRYALGGDLLYDLDLRLDGWAEKGRSGSPSTSV